MSFTIKGELSGLREVMKRLDSVNTALRRTILRKAVTAGGRIIRSAVRGRAPTRAKVGGNIVDLKLLKKSIALRVRVYRNGGAVVAVIGPQTGMKEVIGIVTRGSNKGQWIYEDPAHVAHLVEFGHGGPHAAGANPFVRPGFQDSKATAAELVRQLIEAGISQALSGNLA